MLHALLDENGDDNMSNNGNSTQRINEIDVLKGLGMLLVILGHCVVFGGGKNSVLYATILSFHMPLFFFASGLLYVKRDIKETIAKKAASLLWPVIFYSMLNVLIHEILHLANLDSYSIIRILAFDGFWFLLSLLFIVLLQCFVEKYAGCMVNKTSWGISIAIIILFFGLMYSKLIAGKEVILATALVGYGFYSFGIYFGQLIRKLIAINEKMTGRFILMLLGIICLMLLSCSSTLNKNVLMYVSDYGDSLLFVGNAVLGIIGSIFLAFSIKKNQVLEYFGKNSLIILITHFPVYQILIKICGIAFPDQMWLAIFAGFTATCIVEAIIVYIINRFFPIFNCRLF
jgi:fucose 4-O-acetylase-like acetyltransferase